MTRWDEQHFLDTLMPLLAERAASERLPDDQAPSSVVDGEHPGGVISLRALKSFPARDLAQRLQHFDQADDDAPDQAWEQAEERLDQWMRGFLASAAVNAHRQSAEGLPAKTKRAGLSGFFKLTRWILIPAAVCSVIAVSFLAGRRSLTPHGQEVAVNRIPVQSSQDVVAPPTPKNTPPETKPETAPARAQETASITSRSSRPNSELPASRQVAAPAPEFHPTPPGTVGLSESAPQTPPDVRSNQLPKAPDSGTTTEAATARQVPNDHPGTPVAVRATRSINANSNPVASVSAPHPNLPIRNLIHLEAGTRVWISLKSVRRQSEVLSEFDGTLLLPVTQSGSVVLDRDTRVSGTISTVGAKTTIRIQEFQLSAASYDLTNAGGGMTVHTASAGAAVEFDAGKVIETWVSSASTYSRRADAQARPNP